MRKTADVKTRVTGLLNRFQTLKLSPTRTTKHESSPHQPSARAKLTRDQSSTRRIATGSILPASASAKCAIGRGSNNAGRSQLKSRKASPLPRSYTIASSWSPRSSRTGADATGAPSIESDAFPSLSSSKA
jgi:hypothetical protein